MKLLKRFFLDPHFTPVLANPRWRHIWFPTHQMRLYLLNALGLSLFAPAFVNSRAVYNAPITDLWGQLWPYVVSAFPLYFGGKRIFTLGDIVTTNLVRGGHKQAAAFFALNYAPKHRLWIRMLPFGLGALAWLVPPLIILFKHFQGLFTM